MLPPPVNTIMAVMIASRAMAGMRLSSSSWLAPLTEAPARVVPAIESDAADCARSGVVMVEAAKAAARLILKRLICKFLLWRGRESNQS